MHFNVSPLDSSKLFKIQLNKRYVKSGSNIVLDTFRNDFIAKMHYNFSNNPKFCFYSRIVVGFLSLTYKYEFFFFLYVNRLKTLSLRTSCALFFPSYTLTRLSVYFLIISLVVFSSLLMLKYLFFFKAFEVATYLSMAKHGALPS